MCVGDAAYRLHVHYVLQEGQCSWSVPRPEHNYCLWYRVGPGESPVMYWAQDWVLGVLIVKTLYRCAREEQLEHAQLRQLGREADLCLTCYLHAACHVGTDSPSGKLRSALLLALDALWSL